VTEVLRMESDVVTLQDIFVAEAPTGEGVAGNRLLGTLTGTGLKPHFLEKIAGNGVVLPPSFFTNDDADTRRSFSVASFGGVGR
jgi:pilus assembly protein CpaF